MCFLNYVPVLFQKRADTKSEKKCSLNFFRNPKKIYICGEQMKGTDIKGPVASEAAERWPRVSNAANTIV